MVAAENFELARLDVISEELTNVLSSTSYGPAGTNQTARIVCHLSLDHAVSFDDARIGQPGAPSFEPPAVQRQASQRRHAREQAAPDPPAAGDGEVPSPGSDTRRSPVICQLEPSPSTAARRESPRCRPECAAGSHPARLKNAQCAVTRVAHFKRAADRHSESSPRTSTCPIAPTCLPIVVRFTPPPVVTRPPSLMMSKPLPDSPIDDPREFCHSDRCR